MALEMKFYFVGGYVRDKLLGIESENLDLVLVPKENPIKEFRNAVEKFKNEGYELLFISQFYTAKFKKANVVLDLALARKEIYHFNGALPTVEFVYSIEEDLKRRDFTINSIAMDLEGKVIDPFKGLEHLKKRILVPISSLLDDPTRIFRGIRYSRRLNLRYSFEFLNQINSAKRYLKYVSFPRIRKELGSISVEKNRILMWRDITSWKLFPNLSWNEKLINFDMEIPKEEKYWVFFYCFLMNYNIEIKNLTKFEKKVINFFYGEERNFEFKELASRMLKHKNYQRY
jgi:tRNA nucleotidyltransferase/poly(A) polymerase